MNQRQPGLRQLPKKHVLQHEIREIEHPLKKHIAKSSHQVMIVEQLTTQDLYFFKLNNKINNKGANHKNSEYEAVAGELYAFMLGADCVSQPIGVFTEAGERIGVMSRPVLGFQSFASASHGEYLNSRKYNLPRQRLFTVNLASVLVAAYVLEENDLHLGNIGFNQQKHIAKIDHNQTFFSLTSKYLTLSEKVVKKDVQITADNLLSFPSLKKHLPARWVIDEWKTSVLKSAHLDDQFNHQKYMAFLQWILLPYSVIHESAHNHFTTAKGADRFINYLADRLKILETELMKVTPFLQLLLDINNQKKALFSVFPEQMHELLNNQLENLQAQAILPTQMPL